MIETQDYGRFFTYLLTKCSVHRINVGVINMLTSQIYIVFLKAEQVHSFLLINTAV